MNDRAGQGARDAVKRLHLGDNQLAEFINVASLSPNDHVIGAGHVFSHDDTLDVGDRLGDIGSLAILFDPPEELKVTLADLPTSV